MTDNSKTKNWDNKTYEEMGFAKLDTDRKKRTGFAEVVFCERKSDVYLVEIYKKLYEKGVNLVFLNEPLINTSVFDSTKNNLLNISIETGNGAVDEYFNGNVQLINKLLMALAEEQIKAAFDQSEKEVSDLHIRISEGLRESRKNGKIFGMPKGAKIKTKKQLGCIDTIKKHCVDFGGSLSDLEVIKLCGISRNSFYKYKRELKTIS